MDEALNLSQSPVFGGVEALIKSLHCKGYVSFFLRGPMSDAKQRFETAAILYKKHFVSTTRLHGLGCIWWAEFLLSRGERERCREVTEDKGSLRVSQTHSWKETVPPARSS